MTPRLMVVCLGGLAGAGALVCCDLNEGLETDEAAPETEGPGGTVEAAAPDEGESDAAAVH